MDDDQPQAGASVVRIHFRHTSVLAPGEVTKLLNDLVGGLPIAPDQVEVGPSGSGSVLYGGDETLTLKDLTGVVAWLRRHPHLDDVWWEAAIDV
jgi:hypothetical protein